MSNLFLDQRTEYDRAGFKWLLDPRQTIDGSIISNSVWEPRSTAIFNRFVKPGDTVVDVGANIGWYTLLASRLVGPTGRVLAFEPTEAMNLLRKHLKMNGIRNVGTYRVALGATEGVVKEALNYSWPPTLSDRKVPVAPVESLDDLKFERLDFLKLDTDGYEADILQGAQETLVRLKPKLLVEICEYTLRRVAGIRDENQDPYLARTMLEKLSEIGYTYRAEQDLASEGISEILTSTDLMRRSTNVLCVPPGCKEI